MTRKITTALVLSIAVGCGHAGAQRRGGGKSSVMKLMDDLQQAVPRATLSEEQSSKVQSDITSLKQAMQARQQGQAVDQDQLKATLNDLHQLVDSGAFQQADQKQLDEDFSSLHPQGPGVSAGSQPPSNPQ